MSRTDKKKDFRNVLKYGWCQGVKDPMPGDVGCRKKHPAAEPKECQLNGNDCNCCETCRTNCTLLKIVRDRTKESLEEKMKELNEETLNILRGKH